MEKKLRVLFFGLNGGDWIWPIEDMLADLSIELEIELFIISNRKENLKDCFIDFRRFRSSLSFQQISNLQLKKVGVPKKLINREINVKKVTLKSKINELKIEKELNLWINQAEVFYKILEPDIVIIWNGQSKVSSVFNYMAKKLRIPLFFAEKGALPNSWYLDPLGINANSGIAKMNSSFFKVTDDEIKGFFTKIKEIDNKGDSAWEQPKKKDITKLILDLGVKKDQKIIFFPCQVENDSNIICFSKFFKTNHSVIKWIMKDVSDDYFLLVKMHPMGFDNKKELESIIGNKGKVVNTLNIIDAICLTDIMVTINSTVGFEASIRKKPVLQLGEGIMSNKSFIHDFKPDQDSLSQIKRCIQDYEENSEEYFNSALKFGSFLYFHYYTFRDDKQTTTIVLSEILKTICPKTKKYLFAEAKVFFTPISYLHISKHVPGKTILKALLYKIKSRLFKKKYKATL